MAEQLKCLYSSEIARFQYLLHLPSGYHQSGERRWPLLLFLHGWGESGDDLDFLKYHGVPKYLDTSDGPPFVVLAPQAPEGIEWQELTRELLDFLDCLLSEYDADPDRIYLTGLSTGGKEPGPLRPKIRTFSQLWPLWQPTFPKSKDSWTWFQDCGAFQLGLFTESGTTYIRWKEQEQSWRNWSRPTET